MHSLAALLAMLGATMAIDGLKCGQKNTYVVQAVNAFCAKTDMAAPSPYSRDGGRSSPSYAIAQINGNCNPPQWVPSNICRSQFFQMCNQGDALGNNYRRYGRDNCQVWQLTAVKSQHGNAGPVPSQVTLKGGFKEILKGLGIGRRDVEDWLDQDDQEQFGEEEPAKPAPAEI